MPDTQSLIERLREADAEDWPMTTNDLCEEAAAELARLIDDNERLRCGLRGIQIEAEREQGHWQHLKRVIAAQARASLTGDSHNG